MEIAYFERLQEKNTNMYFKVAGGPGRTANGYQEIISFLNEDPIISVEHNNISLLVGTWCTYEVGKPITKEEYEKAYKIATEGEFRIY